MPIFRGHNTAVLTIAQAALADAGTYRVEISATAPLYSCFSDDAVLTVIQDIEIIEQPVTEVKCAGATASFTVNASGAGLSYQWRRGAATIIDGGRISGANTATLVITNVNAGDAATNYNVVISGVSGICPQSISADVSLIR